jgi:acetyl-CoA C-acetyltransferase
MQEVVIAGYLRTAQSRSRPSDPGRDWFHTLRADELLAQLLPGLIAAAGVRAEEIDDFLVGSAMGVSEQWTFGGRTPIFLANLSEKIPAKFIDQQCGSSMAAVHIAFMEIATGFADIALAGGMEHMTRVPMGPTLFENGTIIMHPDLSGEEKYAHWDMSTSLNMGLTAEKLARVSGIDRSRMDRWAQRSHRLAQQAVEEGFFDGEILPVTASQADGSELTVRRDQAIRKEVSLARLAELKPVFRADGVITAGNASPLNAGASAMLLMNREAALHRNVIPLARMVSIGFAGVDPTVMGAGPVPAVRIALEKAGLDAGDIDYWEINEAFSVVALNCIDALDIDPERVNVMGGAIAIGHALGATGIRLTGTLARILKIRGGRLGCACACIGGGQGVATIIETV